MELDLTGRSDSIADICIAVLTFRRPEQLARVLGAVVEQAAALTPPAGVLVVDNDPAGGARVGVTAWQERGVRYVHEPRPGISSARNRALDEAAGSRALVFIDDDEIPGPGWLAALVSQWRLWRCAAVTGPVVSSFESAAVDPWVVASGAFLRRVRVTGSTVRGAATNNLLLDLAEVARLGVRFDEHLGLTGGEDTLFTHQLVAFGAEIRWCDEAEVHEPVPASRSTRRWVLRRTYRAGTSWSRMELQLATGPRARARTRASLVTRGVARTVTGSARWSWGVLRRDVTHRAQGQCMAVSHLGLLAGAAGFGFGEYHRA